MEGKEIEISRELLEKILKLCKVKLIFSGDEDKVRSGEIKEVCGILIGEVKGNKIVVDEVREAENIADSQFLFEVSPYDLYNAYVDAQSRGKEVVGIFHSHPHGSPTPSSLDVRGIKDAGLVWMIVGKDEIKAFLYNNKLNKIVELTIKLK